MKLVIGHLYNDLMNLYGEIGNIKALKYQLEQQGIKVEIKNLSINDNINFDELDIIYMGSGTEDNRLLVLEDILKYKKDIKKAIEENKTFLITGNALSLFGKSLNDQNNNTKEALNIFNFEQTNSKDRIVKEITTHSNLIKEDIYGFMNHSDIISKHDNYLFDNEGICYKKFYGTHIIGPLLIRNPEFLKYLIKQIITSKDKNFKIKKIDTSLEKKAYQEFINFKRTKLHIR